MSDCIFMNVYITLTLSSMGDFTDAYSYDIDIESGIKRFLFIHIA